MFPLQAPEAAKEAAAPEAAEKPAASAADATAKPTEDGAAGAAEATADKAAAVDVKVRDHCVQQLHSLHSCSPHHAALLQCAPAPGCVTVPRCSCFGSPCIARYLCGSYCVIPAGACYPPAPLCVHQESEPAKQPAAASAVDKPAEADAADAPKEGAAAGSAPSLFGSSAGFGGFGNSSGGFGSLGGSGFGGGFGGFAAAAKGMRANSSYMYCAGTAEPAVHVHSMRGCS
jgi:hypothetical protein